MKSLILLFTAGLIVLLAACTVTGEMEPASGDLFEVATVAARPSATATPHTTPTSPPLDPTVLTTTPWPPDPIASPTPVPPFPGMVYTTDEGLWHINANWQPELLFDRSGVLEQNGRRLLYEQEGDIWLADLQTNTQQNLTNTPDANECCAQWWPSRPDTFLVMRQIPDSAYEIGQITAVTLDGDYTVLVEELGASLPAISPDGQTIAFEVNGQPALYHLESGIELLTLLTRQPNQSIGAGSPSWSPDGQKVAWQARLVDEAGQTLQTVVIYELTTASDYLLHPYQPGGIDSWGPAPVWSPNGEFVAFSVMDQNWSQHGLWVVSIDYTGRYVGDSDDPVWRPADPIWSPDGRYLLYRIGEDYFLTVPPDFTAKINVHLPPGARVLGWQELP